MCNCEKEIRELEYRTESLESRFEYLERLIFNEENLRSCDTCRYQNLSSQSEICTMCCGVGEGLFPEWRASDE